MTLIEINQPYTVKSKSGVDYTKYHKVYYNKEKAMALLMEEEKQKEENRIKNQAMASRRYNRKRK